jgi:hypothetical protein
MIYGRIRRKRPSLRIIVSSATLDAMSFHDYFCSGISPQEATIISLEGRMYPVEVAYLTEPATDYIKMAVEVTWKINLQVRLVALVCGLCSPEGDMKACSWRYSRISDGSGRHRAVSGGDIRTHTYVRSQHVQICWS